MILQGFSGFYKEFLKHRASLCHHIQIYHIFTQYLYVCYKLNYPMLFIYLFICYVFELILKNTFIIN